jgi:signal transduction histidine kinase
VKPEGPWRIPAPIEAALSPFRRLSVRMRLVIALSFIALFGVGTASLFLLSTVTDEAATSMIAGAQNTTQQATEVLSRGLSLHHERTFEQQVRADRALHSVLAAAIASVTSIQYIAIVDTNDVAVLHTAASLTGQTLTPVPEAQHLVNEGMVQKLIDLSHRGDYEFVQPIERGGHQVGAIRVGLASQFVRSALLKPVRQSLVLVLVALLLAILLAIALANFITRPLQKLMVALDAASRGDFDQHLDSMAADEDLQRLFKSFNSMTARVAEDRTVNEERTRQLAGLVDGLEDGVLMVAQDGRIELANPTACRILAQPERALVGQNLELTLGANHPLSELWRESLDPGGQRERSEVAFDSDVRGDHFLLLAYPAPPGKDGRSDVVLTLRNSDSLRKLTSLLDESHRMIAWGQVALGVAHEIKNPLQAMNLHLELAREKIARPGAQQDVPGAMRNFALVAQQIHRLDDVINGFLNFARMTHAQREPVQLNGILSEVAGFLASEAERQGTEIRFTPRPGLPQPWGDSVMLHQLFRNLVHNAVYAGPHSGPIEIQVEAPSKGGLVVTVVDHGKGIPRAEKDHVFDLFFTKRENGSGMGLAIVQRAVQLHGGQIALESEEGRGTKVRVTLPLNVPLDTHLMAAVPGEV